MLLFYISIQESADLVVGADGLRSAVRELAFGENFAPNFTGYQVCSVKINW